jgi:hypothetical protein
MTQSPQDDPNPSIIKKYLVGIKVPPFFVAHARGFAEGAVMAALGAVAIFVFGFDYSVFGLPRELTVLAPGALLYIVRASEGVADQVIDPTQNRRPPVKPGS